MTSRQTAAPTDMTDDKAEDEARREHDSVRSQFLVLNQAVISSGHAAVQNLFLMHGGALVAMLIFTGGILQKEDPAIPLTDMVGPMIWFAVKLALATGASAGAYLTNYCHVSHLSAHRLDWTSPFSHETRASKNWLRAGHCFHVLTLLTAVTSLAVFVLGFFAVKSALLQ